MAVAASEIEALEAGRGVVRLEGWWLTVAAGEDAAPWLDDLVTARVSDLLPGQARRSLLLTPTGRIRADFTVAKLEEGFLLVQDPRQPEPVATLLDRYVLSSKVELTDRTADWRVVALPGHAGSEGDWSPSALGAGHDILLREPGAAAPEGPGLVAESLEAVEAWRIRAGVPRFPVDLGTDSLPHEAGLERDIPEKGCYLGQEAVAKVRNLGHPPRVVRAFRADGPVAAGEAIRSGDRALGEVTSATAAEGGTAVIARLRWGVTGALRTEGGATITPAGGATPD